MTPAAAAAASEFATLVRSATDRRNAPLESCRASHRPQLLEMMSALPSADDPVDDRGHRGDARGARRLVAQDLGLRGDAPDHLDVERDLGVGHGPRAAVDLDAPRRRPGRSGDPVPGADLLRVESGERQDGDRQAPAVEPPVGERRDVVGRGDVERPETAARDRVGARDGRPVEPGHPGDPRPQRRWNDRLGQRRFVAAPGGIAELAEGGPERVGHVPGRAPQLEAGALRRRRHHLEPP